MEGFLELWAGKAMGDKNVKRKADEGLVCEITEDSLRPPLQDFIMDVHVTYLNLESVEAAGHDGARL